ncbi:MAG: Maf family protein [Woeseia sp.]
MTTLPLHLASASPRRREILTSLGLRFTYSGEDLDEQEQPGESAEELVVRLASDKATAALQSRPTSAVLGADTVVVLDGKVFGKPGDKEEAIAMLAALSGRTHEVMTGVALLSG